MPRHRALARLQVIKVTPNVSGGSDANAPAFSWRQVTASFLPFHCVFAFFFFKDVIPHPLHILLCSEQCAPRRWHRCGRRTARANCSSWPRAAGTAGQRVEPRPGVPQIIPRPAAEPGPTASGSSLAGLAGSTNRGEESLKKWESALKRACLPKTASLPCLTWEGHEAQRSIPCSACTSPPSPAPSRAPRSPVLPGLPLSLQCCWKWPLPFALINLSLSPEHIWGRGKRWEHSGKGPRINLRRLHVTKPLPSE